MKILLVLAAMLLTCFVTGQLLASVFSKKRKPLSLSGAIGYAYLTVAFYLFYFAFRSAQTATYVALGLPLAVGGTAVLGRFLGRRRALRPAEKPSLGQTRPREALYLAIAAVLVVAFAVWPYLSIGWGKYWHSGNEDVEDELNGRDAYLDRTIFSSEYDPSRLYDPGELDLQKVTRTVPKEALKSQSYRDWYASGGFRLQYSSAAFWSVVFHNRFGIDLVMEQALTDLILMLLGVYALARWGFSLSPAAAAVAGAAAVLSGFYLGTFVAGHIGSMMYGALIPCLLYLILAAPDQHVSTAESMVYAGLLLAAIGFSYPEPAALVLPAAVGYRIWKWKPVRERLRRAFHAAMTDRKRIALTAVVLLLVSAAILLLLWHLTAGYRLRQAMQYRAWGYTHDWLIVPIFLGLIPSPLIGAIFVGAGLGVRAYWMLTAASSVVAVVLGILYLRFKPAANRGFLVVFALSWVAGFGIFRYFIVDSYYLYKFLYTHQFLFVIGIVGFCASSSSRTAKSLCWLVLAANLAVDTVMMVDLYRRPYNHESRDYAQLARVDAQILRNCYVGLAGGAGTAIRQTISGLGIKGQADFRRASYAVVPSDPEAYLTGSQFTETVARIGERLAIKRVPLSDGLMVQTPATHYIEGEVDRADPALRSTIFLWVGSGINDNVGIYVFRPSPDPSASHRFLRLCLENGPSAIGSIPVTFTAGSEAELAHLDLDGVQCAWLPAEQVRHLASPLVIRSGARGKSLLPFDDRILLYRIFAVAWTDRKYDDAALSFLNLREDIVSHPHPGGSRPFRLQLGNGWKPYEQYAGEAFRWAGLNSELVLEGQSDGVANIALTVEPGPSQGNQPSQLTVADATGSIVFRSPPFRDRKTLHFQLHYALGSTAIYTLRTNSQHLRLASDPRILDYRVFKIEAH